MEIKIINLEKDLKNNEKYLKSIISLPIQAI